MSKLSYVGRLAVRCGVLGMCLAVSGCWVAKDEFSKANAVLAGDIKANRDAVDDLKKRVDSYDARVAAVEKSVDEISASASKLKSRLAKIESRMTQHGTKLGNLRTDLDNASVAVAGVRKSVSTMATQETIDKVSRELDTRFKTLKKKDDELGGSLDDVSGVAEDLVKDVKELKVSTSTLRSEMKDLSSTTTTTLAEQNGRIAGFRRALATVFKAELESLAKRLKELQAASRGMSSPGAGAPSASGRTAPKRKGK